MTLLLKNAIYIDWQTLEFRDTNILVDEGDNGNITFLDSLENFDISNFTCLDCKGRYVTKSFAVGHHHVYSALARGMNAPKNPPSNFLEILENIWWVLDKSLDKEMIEASALATAIACAKAGSTYVIDHHSSPENINGALEIIANAFDKVGVSHLLCYEITDRNGKSKTEAAIEETDNYLIRNNGLVGLHASFTVGDDTLSKAVELAEKHNSGIHIHVAEDKYDQKYCEDNYGKNVVDRLNSFGILNSSKNILAHCLHLSPSERKIIADSKSWIVQNAESNLNNNVGDFNSSGLGGRVFLGTDGMHSDMLQSAKAAFFSGQKYDDFEFSSAYHRFRNVHSYLKENKFSGDSDNNLVVLDYDTPTDFNKDNFIGHFIYGLNSNHVQHVISNGRVIVKDHIVQTVQEDEILEFCRHQSLRLWESMKLRS